jgi:hypothetical protein
VRAGCGLETLIDGLGPLKSEALSGARAKRRSSMLSLAQPAAALASALDWLLQLLGVYEGTIHYVRRAETDTRVPRRGCNAA